MSGWRPALRIARRSMRRHLGRSVLIAALIGVPIAGATVIDGLIQTEAGPEHDAYASLGTADGSAEVTAFAALPREWQPGGDSQPVPVGPATDDPATDDGAPVGDRDPASVDVASLLPDGSRVVPDDHSMGMLRLRQGDRVVRTYLNLVAIGDPLTVHEARLVSGRLPRGSTEVLITEPLADRLHLLDGDELRAGATITAEGARPIAVTGIAVTPRSIGQQAVVARPDSVLRKESSVDDYADNPRYLVDLPAGVDPDTVWPALAAKGIVFTPRTFYTDPGRYPMAYSSENTLETFGAIAVVVGFGLLEVVLLAGAAFAVGARRQVRELGLIAANGGTAKHVRRTVLAQGLVLGLTGTVGGLLFGGLLLVAGWQVWQQLVGEVIDGWRFGWPELVAAGVVGLLSGLAAALLPAIGAARMRPIDALAQRFRITRLGARLPWFGVGLLAVGVVGVLAAGWLGRQRVAATEANNETAGASYVQPDLDLPTIAVLGFGLLMVVGIIMVVSALVVGVARLGGRLPLSGRMAVRDTGRHRHRTVPAIAAIMVVVAGSVMLAITFATDAAGQLKSHPDNTLMMRPDPSLISDDSTGYTPKGVRELAQGSRDVAGKIPGASRVEVATLVDASDVAVSLAGEQNCAYTQLGVARPEVLDLALDGGLTDGQRAALDRGQVVSLDGECSVRSGTVRTEPQEEDAKPVVLSATVADRPAGTYYYDLPGAYISARAAAEQGWKVRVEEIAVRYPAETSQDDLDAALTSAEDHGFDVWRDQSEEDEIELVNLALAGGAGLITLLGVGITVALSAAESRADLATLAAVGARPRRRRTLAGAQALVLSGLGTALGLLLGGVLGYAMGPLSGESTFAVPWSNLGITVVVVPLLAIGVAMVATRSKLPMVRRVD